jgi:hypothetical protein
MPEGFNPAATRRPDKMDDRTLLALIDAESRNSVGYLGGRMAGLRQKALQYYLSQAYGDLAPPEVAGRSTIVTTDALEVVEAILPYLMRVFTSGERVVEFEPAGNDGPQQESIEDTATEMVNYTILRQNDGWITLYTWFKDALISKLGVIKVYWDEKIDPVREEYDGLTDLQLVLLSQDQNVELIECTSQPDPSITPEVTQALEAAGRDIPQIHDIAVRRTRKGRVRIECVPPEEFLVSRRATSLERDKCPFVAHRFVRTIGQLRQKGYAKVDDVEFSQMDTEDASIELNPERVTRVTFDDEQPFLKDPGDQFDPSMREVTVTEAYMPVDYNGDGIPEWRKITKVGHVILDNVEVDEHPFCDVTPVPLPHRLFGLSAVDLVMQPMRANTALMRAMLDGLYHSINGRTFAVENKVNLDDLLTSRPGGVVRVKEAGAVGPLNEGKADLQAAMVGQGKIQEWRQNVSGVTAYTQGSDADVLNKTAHGIEVITNRADARNELIARVMGETGVKRLFIRTRKLLAQHQDTRVVMKVAGKWIDSDPREWATEYNTIVSVGLGSGSPQIKQARAMQILQIQEKLGTNPLTQNMVTQTNVYNAVRAYVNAVGYKNVDAFITDSSGQPPPQPQVPPEVQLKQMELAGKAQVEQAKMAMLERAEQAKAQREMMIAQRQQADEDQRAHDALQARLVELGATQSFAEWKEKLDASVKIAVAEIAAKAALVAKAPVPVSEGDAPMSEDNEAMPPPDLSGVMAVVNEGIQKLLAEQQATFGNLASVLSAPRRVRRDPATGDIVGTEPVLPPPSSNSGAPNA